ncbi:FAD-dependent oxidoreductase [Desulfurivibrio alkaliphilus]|uniref:FAD dependent oxidoreductase n=1 Tax=Desulfurivibrio alkaliphilus (strain DSM 19089 / UNIQEM U267 / AHT2) TaxID=589865 RepID=D6Z5V3_DESAT|nr:FAD-dependent oxidoreductase [Desulfurivibrio alkaliphilus]ADH84835.1 FAD dependent oxidoreductase [Desulfurivibrio alkaliphilus AHT 2]
MKIVGSIDGKRVSSRELEERVQAAVNGGAHELEIEARGQHGIGGRIWPKHAPVKLRVQGPIGQRLGAMGMMGTEIVAEGGASDDVGWLNCGAKITVLGDVTNGAHNAGAQGVLYVQGGGGARCDTMTKHNPRFEPLQSWYFRDVGDSFAEFKAGGIAVVCGVNPRHPENVLGYRPCVGMVGGVVYFRGNTKGYSEKDVQLLELTEADWQWLTDHIKPYLAAIDRLDYLPELTKSAADWHKLIAYTPAEKKQRSSHRLATWEFRRSQWEPAVGKGGIFGDMIERPFTLLPFITTGQERRFKPVWNNEKQLPPCVAVCPSDIPSHRRFQLLRQGKRQEALDLVLQYSPLAATVCGELCPNICMKACSRKVVDQPLDIKGLGRASRNLTLPKPATASGKQVAVIGGGPAGLSATWQLWLKGHRVTLYEAGSRLGGRLWQSVEQGKVAADILEEDLGRISAGGMTIHLDTTVDADRFKSLRQEHDGIIIACGAQDKEGTGLAFVGPEIHHQQGKIKTNQHGQTDELKVFAAGDVVSRGLPTHLIGSGRRAALALNALLTDSQYHPESRPTIPYAGLKLEYFAFQRGECTTADGRGSGNGNPIIGPVIPTAPPAATPESEAIRCVSCGLCRDCHICENTCHYGAISRRDLGEGEFEYVVDPDRCIGCGFCAGTCPCGIWEMEENI